jgi:hypothetical protein
MKDERARATGSVGARSIPASLGLVEVPADAFVFHETTRKERTCSTAQRSHIYSQAMLLLVKERNNTHSF